jgi:hypothetical protein
VEEVDVIYILGVAVFVFGFIWMLHDHWSEDGPLFWVENPFGFPSSMKNFHNSAMFVGGSIMALLFARLKRGLPLRLGPINHGVLGCEQMIIGTGGEVQHGHNREVLPSPMAPNMLGHHCPGLEEILFFRAARRRFLRIRRLISIHPRPMQLTVRVSISQDSKGSLLLPWFWWAVKIMYVVFMM